MNIQNIASVKVLHTTPGNDWETGNHIVSPVDSATKVVPKGKTYYVDILNSRGDTVISELRYQVGSGLTHDERGRELPLDSLGVIASFIRDAECGEDTFEWFCDSLGYDTDSRTALETYLTCQKRAAEIARGFTAAEQETLKEFANEY